jgi:hypothetical protein
LPGGDHRTGRYRHHHCPALQRRGWRGKPVSPTAAAWCRDWCETGLRGFRVRAAPGIVSLLDVMVPVARGIAADLVIVGVIVARDTIIAAVVVVADVSVTPIGAATGRILGITPGGLSGKVWLM